MPQELGILTKKAEPNDSALFNDLLIMVEPVGFEPTT